MRLSVDAFPAVLDVRIDCHNTCTLVASPSSINVSAGTDFEVNWINVGDTDCDVAKIDQFNQVPIIQGLAPGTSYHDPVPHLVRRDLHRDVSVPHRHLHAAFVHPGELRRLSRQSQA